MPNGVIQIDKDTFQDADEKTQANMIYDLVAHMYESQAASHIQIDDRLAGMEKKMVSKARRDAALTVSSGLSGGFIAVAISRVFARLTTGV